MCGEKQAYRSCGSPKSLTRQDPDDGAASLLRDNRRNILSVDREAMRNSIIHMLERNGLGHLIVEERR